MSSNSHPSATANLAMNPTVVLESDSSSGILIILIKCQTVCILSNIFAGKLTNIVSIRSKLIKTLNIGMSHQKVSKRRQGCIITQKFNPLRGIVASDPNGKRNKCEFTRAIHIILCRVTTTLQWPQIKQDTASMSGGTNAMGTSHNFDNEAMHPTVVSENYSLSGMLIIVIKIQTVCVF